MFRRTTVVVAAVALLSPGLTTSASQAASDARAVWITSAPKNVNEGKRIEVGVKVASPQKAKGVQLQERQEDVLGNYSWVTIRSRAVNGSSRHTFKVVATAKNVAKYRARVSYRSGGPTTSKVAAVTVWRWISLLDYRPYYNTNGVIAAPYNSFNINGSQYLGWKTYGSYPSWESRYTPGRHCKAFTGVLGVTDDSADGSTATISLGTDADSTIYSSPTLSPGMQSKVNIHMNLPYRFIITARSTSASETAVYPAIGNPEFLCTGV